MVGQPVGTPRPQLPPGIAVPPGLMKSWLATFWLFPDGCCLLSPLESSEWIPSPSLTLSSEKNQSHQSLQLVCAGSGLALSVGLLIWLCQSLPALPSREHCGASFCLPFVDV